MRLEPDQWRVHLRRFAQHECRGSSPLYETIALGLAQETELIEWLATVSGPRAHATLPLAAVHYLLLSGVSGEGLEAFYPNLTDEPASHTQAFPAFRAFFARERERLTPLLATRVTQTNEVGRCAYLLPALVLAAERSHKPLAIVDVGCSAGLNLLFDRYAYEFHGKAAGDSASEVKLRPELRGGTVVATPTPVIFDRVGIDLEPIEADNVDATRWLEACTWPEHVQRLRNLRAALAIARRERPRLVKGNAVAVLPSVAEQVSVDAALVVLNTNVLFYFSADERAQYGQLLANLGRAREVFWIANEHPAVLASAGFAVTIPRSTEPAALPLVMSHFVRGRRDDRVLADVGPHGRWLNWFGNEETA